MKKLFMLAALGCTAAAFANYGSYNNQPNYQSQGSGGYQNQPYYQSQGNTYYQTQPQNSYYDQNSQYNQNQQYNQGYSGQSSGMSSGYISQGDTGSNMPSSMMEMNKTMEAKKGEDAASTPEDKEINRKIRDKLSNLGIKGYETIFIRTQNGIVMISGSVDKVDDLLKIRDQVKSVEGVKSVNNQVTAKTK